MKEQFKELLQEQYYLYYIILEDFKMFFIKFKDIKSAKNIGLYFITHLIATIIAYYSLNYLFKN